MFLGVGFHVIRQKTKLKEHQLRTFLDVIQWYRFVQIEEETARDGKHISAKEIAGSIANSVMYLEEGPYSNGVVKESKCPFDL